MSKWNKEKKKIKINIPHDHVVNKKKVLENYVKAQELFNTKESLQFVKTHSSLLKGFKDYKNTLGAIYIIRDPRNVVTSIKNHFSKNDYTEALKFITNENN